jgi:hypothetical protein
MPGSAWAGAVVNIHGGMAAVRAIIIDKKNPATGGITLRYFFKSENTGILICLLIIFSVFYFHDARQQSDAADTSQLISIIS